MINELTIAELVDDSNGFLKARLYVYLSRKYANTRTDRNEIMRDALMVFESDAVIPLVKDWIQRV